ncbi:MULTISPECIES: DUF1254 domain-containing protein [unclassified Variovorax]|uniref:DUF1254 domain-containing protein n=1 Tax=unclassified Variovorax TaxID=663243 RepID=UPI001BD3FAD5|nr:MULTISPECIES: DUF1254 domain-containing protein [unclassified Variovorax]
MSSTLDQAARDAVLYTLPLFEMARMRAATCPRKLDSGELADANPNASVRWVNGFRHTRQLLTPRNREVVSPNNDTLYDNAWLDLSNGPLLINVPDMGERYWTLGFLDMWTNPFAYAGRRTTGNRAQRLFVHGPDWKGDVPEATVPVAAPGSDVWIIGRMLASADAADIALAHGLQDQYAIRKAGDASSAAWQRFDTGMDRRPRDVPEVMLYRLTVRDVLKRNPAPAGQGAMLELLDRFGLRHGEPEPDAEAALAIALAETCAALRQDVSASDIGNGWTLPVSVRTDYGIDYPTRARVARNLIGALGMEEAMYPVCEVDAASAPLDGKAHYELCFPCGSAPQVDAFWSLTVYRRRDCLLIDNPIDRYSIGDRTEGLRTETDGSLRIRLQADDPGEGCNWLPTPSDDQFYLTLRLYQPRTPHLSTQFVYPPVVRLD